MKVLAINGSTQKDGCAGKGQCAFKDDMVNDIISKAEEADGFIFGSPVYYAHPSGQLLSLLDRLFYAGGSAFARKPGAAIVTARRTGATASLDLLNKYITDAQMPIVSSNYRTVVIRLIFTSSTTGKPKADSNHKLKNCKK